jgi:hypothetical protein
MDITWINQNDRNCPNVDFSIQIRRYNSKLLHFYRIILDCGGILHLYHSVIADVSTDFNISHLDLSELLVVHFLKTSFG